MADVSDASARGARSRSRGARCEVAIVNYLRTQGWPDARRYLAGDGRQPGDLDWHPLVVLEAKDVASSSWPSWCRQAQAQAAPGQIPAVVRRTRGVTDVGAWIVRVRIVGEDADRVDVELGGRYVAMPGCGGLWVETSMAALVGAVRRLDS